MALLMVLFGEIAMANDADPGMNEIALDIEVTSGSVDIFFNDVPFFGPNQPLEATASIITSLAANSVLGPEKNDVLFRFVPKASGIGNRPAFKARLGYAPAGSFPDPFSEQPFVILVEIKPDPQNPIGFKLDHTVQGQPLLSGRLTSSALKALPDGAFEVSLQLDVGIDLPAEQWLQGRLLSDNAETRIQVESMMRRAHTALGLGPEAIKRELGPTLQRLAATVGITVDQAMATEYSAYTDKTMGFELQPFDASQSKLFIMGNGRLATLYPQPVMFVNEQTKETAAPFLAYWQNKNGEWNIIH